MSLLTMINRAAKKLRLPSGLTDVVGSTDLQIQSLLEIANEEGEDLAKREWEILEKEVTHTALGAELQGVMTTIAGSDYAHIVNKTIWNRSTNTPMFGRLSAREWQRIKSSGTVGVFGRYRIIQGSLYLTPAPTAGDTIAFEVKSKNWCQDSGSTGQSAWAANDDTGILDEDLMRLGVIWRYRESIGLSYAEDFNRYERQVLMALSREGGKPTVSLDDNPEPVFGMQIPEGNWNL